MNAYQRDSSFPSSDPVTVGWSGSFSTVQYLDALRPALRRLSEKEKFQLRFIGTPKYSLEGVQTEALPWRLVSEVEIYSGSILVLCRFPTTSGRKVSAV